MKKNIDNISSIEAIYFTPSQIIDKKSFNPDIQFKEVINYFYSNIQINNENLQLKKNYYYKQYLLNESTNILELFDDNYDDKINIYIELNDTLDNQENIPFILKPKNNPFEIIIYSVNAKTITSEGFEDNIMKINNLDKYTPDFSAYCNSDDSLFISGGIDNNKDPINEFWIINHVLDGDNNKFQIKNIQLPYNKKQHSMLYNKIDNSVIFVGGNDKKCFIYNIDNDNFYDIPETNEICIKPALILKNNILYVFDSFDRTKKFFEKLDFEKKEKFEKFSPNDYSLYNSKFFGVCTGNNNDKIVFLGGEKNGLNTLIYEIQNNNLVNSKGKDIYTKLDDKTFYKINQHYYANIPDSKEKSIIVIYTGTNNVNKIIFDNEGKTTFPFDENEQGDISIEPFNHKTVLDESNHVINVPKLNNNTNVNVSDIFFTQSYNNDYLNIDNSDDVKLKANKKKLSVNKNNEDNNNIDDDFENILINVEQQSKERDTEEKLYKSKNNQKYFIPGSSINDPFSSISINKEEENDNKEVNQNVNKKLKFPINLKLNQSQMVIGNKMNLANSKITYNNNYNDYNNNNSRNRNLARTVYLNYDDDVNLNNNDYNNYAFYEMKPDIKNKTERLNASSNLEIRIKNPFSKSKIVKKKQINGLNYTIVCEKIIDKSNNQFPDSLNMQENFALENDYGNHKLYISQYTDGTDNFPNISDNFDEFERKTQQPIKYKYNTENTNKTERKYNNISTYISNYFNDKNDEKYNNYNKNHNIKITNYSEEKKKQSNTHSNPKSQRKNEQIKTNINYLTERIIEPSNNLSNEYMPGRKISGSEDDFEPTKLRTAERKIENYSTQDKNTNNIKRIKKDLIQNKINNIIITRIIPSQY